MASNGMPGRTKSSAAAWPGADSTVSLGIPSLASTPARNVAPASSLPGGLVVSIMR